jgi:hypothetical protein
MTRPKAGIRRFDVFAEYTRLEKLAEGMPADEAKGYAVWLAKVVAARKYGRIKPGRHKPVGVAEVFRERPQGKFRSLGGVEQTDRLFEKDIVARMGREFYQEVFSPAVAEAYRNGKTYRDIRDTIRKAWRP